MSLNVGIAENIMLPKVGVLDTDAGTNAVNRSLLPAKWLGTIKQMADPGLTTATRHTVDVPGVILLHLQLGNRWLRVWLGGVTGVAVSIRLGRTFIDKVVTEIFPPKRKVVSQQSKPVDIIQKSLKKRRIMTIHDQHGR